MILSDVQHRIRDRLQEGDYFTTAPIIHVEVLAGSVESPDYGKLLATYVNTEGALVVIENATLNNLTWHRDELTVPVRVYENLSENREGESGTRKSARDIAWQIRLMLHGYCNEDEPDLKFRVTGMSPQQNADGLNEWLVEIKTEFSTSPETET